MKLCAFKIDTIRSQIHLYNVTAQSLAEKSVVCDSDYHKLRLVRLDELQTVVLSSETMKADHANLPFRDINSHTALL